MNKTDIKYANPEHYEAAHAFFTSKDNKSALTNPYDYKALLATQGLEVNIYDCKQWIKSLGTVMDAKDFKLS